MTEVQQRNETVDVPHANLARPLFFIGILAGLAAMILFQFAIRDTTLAGYDVTEASYVLALVTVPLIFFAFVWGYRSFTSAMVMGVLGLVVALVGVGLFSYYYPTDINAFDTTEGNQTVLVMNIYLVGILLLLVGLYTGNTLRARRLDDVTRFLRSEPEAVVVSVPAPPIPMGQTLPVSRLEGVRRAETKRLKAAGVHQTGQLLYRDPTELSRAANVDEVRVRAWQSMSDLIRLDGIGPGYAATLYRAGIVNVGQLADETPETLVQRVERAPKSVRSRRMRVDIRRARGWIEEARKFTKNIPTQANATMTTTSASSVAAAQ